MVITINDRNHARTLLQDAVAEMGPDYVYTGPADRKTWVHFAEDGSPVDLLGWVFAAGGLTLGELQVAPPDPGACTNTDLNLCSTPLGLRRAGVLVATNEVCWVLGQAQQHADTEYRWGRVLELFEDDLRDWDRWNVGGSMDRTIEGYDRMMAIGPADLSRVAREDEARCYREGYETIEMLGEQILRERNPDLFPPAAVND